MTRNKDLEIKSKTLSICARLVMCFVTTKAVASGFQLQEQNVTNLGTAYSGTGALAEDASVGYYNPAGLTRIVDSQIVLSGVLIQGTFEMNVSSATASFGSPMGKGSADPGRVAVVPNFHLAKRIDDRWVFGFNVTVPFGLTTKYDENSIARYMATYSDIATVNLGPSIAYQVLPCLSLGVGVDAQYADATLSADVGNNILALDGYQRNHAQGWGYGYHFGLLWEPYETTRIGLSYRSLINLHTEGNTENQTQFGYIITQLRSDITLPETALFSFYHAWSPALAVTGDIAWTNWDRFRTLRLRYDRPIGTPNPTFPFAMLLSPDTDTFEHFKATGRYALGLTYTHNDRWLFRIGTSYDQSPVRDEFRTARLPDSDRYWLAAGGAYNASPNLRIDFGYAHIFFKYASINEHAPFFAETERPVSAATIKGDYESFANLVGIQIRYDFV